MNLPNEVYVVIGSLVLSNLGAIGGLVRGVWYLSKLDSRVSELEKDLNVAFTLLKERKTKGLEE